MAWADLSAEVAAEFEGVQAGQEDFRERGLEHRLFRERERNAENQREHRAKERIAPPPDAELTRRRALVAARVRAWRERHPTPKKAHPRRPGPKKRKKRRVVEPVGLRQTRNVLAQRMAARRLERADRSKIEGEESK